MPEPRDYTLFELTSAVVNDALAFVERSISRKRTIRPCDPWATISWTETRMPDFSFVGTEAPLDYKDVFNPIWRIFMGFGGRTEEEFDFDANPAYQQLKQYIRSEPSVFEKLGFDGIDDSEERFLGVSVSLFVQYAIDRYIHLAGQTTFDQEKFLPIYLPLEAGMLLDSLPIEILVPILLVSPSSDSLDLTDGIVVSKMSDPIQLARVIRAHGTHEANEHLLQQASHSLKLTNYALPNAHLRLVHSHRAETFPLDVIDSFFAALRIVTSAETGYAELLISPVGWATSYKANLPPLEGTTVRKYPPDLKPISAFYGNEATIISDAQFASVRELFAAILKILESGTKRSGRLRLAIKRLNSCFLREDEEDAILDATIGMEVLLSDSESQEVTHKLALRLAALSSLVPKYEGQGTRVFRNVKKAIYPYRSAVVHGDESRANKKREIAGAAGHAIPAVKLATEYLGMAVQAVASNPEFLDPSLIDERLLLDRPAYSQE